MMHLFAEILENATVFSPPASQVSVRGELVARGFAIEVEDRGLGLTEERRAAINERLASPPEFDPADTDRLGFAVVGLLAARYGVDVDAALLAVRRDRGGHPHPRGFCSGSRSPSSNRRSRRCSRSSARGPSREGQETGRTERTGEPAVRSDSRGPVEAAAARAGGLPRRVRQANMSPRLARGSRPPDVELEERSPEEARALMSALQSGWQRGRADDEDGGARAMSGERGARRGSVSTRRRRARRVTPVERSRAGPQSPGDADRNGFTEPVGPAASETIRGEGV